jgi:rare lipoprotein A
MIRRAVKQIAIFALLSALAACAGRTSHPLAESEHGTYKVGRPYEVDGIWYYPAVDWSYDQTGIASWYGKEFHGRYTANGEIFDLNALTAAHPTLPLPSIVQVTNLENGRSIELRVNDRGPYVAGRIIDVSRRAAQLLGFEEQGTAKVRVKLLVSETMAAESLARSGAPPPVNLAAAAPVAAVAAEPLAPAPGTRAEANNPEPLPTAPPAPPFVPAAAAAPVLPGTVTIVPVKPSQIYIQAGAFAVARNALAVKRRLDALGEVKVTGARVNGVDLYRVRLGPIGSVDEADKLLSRVFAAGLTGARIIVD